MRYVLMKQSNGTWSVSDRVFNILAQINGRVLMGLSRRDAERNASKANEMWLRCREPAPPGKV